MMLVTQQRLANPSKREVPEFSGDPFEFLPFLKAFEHIIHSRTYNDEDHMSARRGYNEARKLLTYHYGNEQKIAAAYVDRAVKLKQKMQSHFTDSPSISPDVTMSWRTWSTLRR